MNRLKYVLGIHVPHRVPSNVYRKHHSDARLPKSTRLFPLRTNNLYDCRGLHYAEQERDGITYPAKSTSSLSEKTSLERHFPLPCVYKDRHSSCLLVRPTGRKHSAGKSKEQIAEPAKNVKNSKPREIDVTDGLAVKEHRSYAQMIADYSETIYARSGIGIARDGASLITFNGIQRSPFSTASAVSPKWKSKDKATKKASFRATGSGAVQQEAKFSSGAFVSRYDCRNDHRNIVQGIGNNTDLERASSSYATMIEKYSNATHVSVDSSGCGNTAVPRRNVSTKFSHVSMAFLDTKDHDRLEQASPGNAGSNDLSNEETSNVDKQEPIGWITKMEDVIKDLKRVTAKKDEAPARANEKLVLQSVHERAHWLDRVVTAHKKRIKDRKPISGKPMVEGKVDESTEVAESAYGNDTVLAAPKGDHDPIIQAPEMAARNKPTDPVSQYIKPRPGGSNVPTKSSSQTPTTTTTTPMKQPQIELRMTPSQNESIVSINVDEQATKTAGTRDQLSVVISSKKDKTGQVDASNPNQQSDFGSMQISISENTVPVKQIEFSINGKPVSELKSIVARADKLDVVSSMDKVEIRIPPSQNRAVSEQTQNLARTASSPMPVLNLQIAAKFNEPRIQHPTNTGVRTTTTPTTTPTTKPIPPPIPPRTKPLFTAKPPFGEVNKADVTSVEKNEHVAGTQQNNPVPTFDARASISKQETAPNVAESSPPTVKGNDATIHTDSSTNAPPTSLTRQPPVNIGDTNLNKSPEDRAPSNMKPWWTSEYSFKTISIKKNTPKDATAPVEDKTSTTETRESVDSTQSTALDQQLSSVNPSKTVSPVLPGKDAAAKKPISDEEQKFDADDTTHRVVRVRSPQKRATTKSVCGVKTSKHVKRNSTSGIGRIGKKVKHRPKSNLAKNVAAAIQEPDTLTASTPHSPKAVKYVSVTPQRANVSEKPETPKATSPRTEVTDAQPTISWKVEGSKAEEESKTTANVPKPAGPQKYIAPVGKANVQNSKTIHKATGLEKPANKSAGVSAESSAQFAKGREQDKTNSATEKKLSRGSETVNEVSNQRLKEILKSMKPIEKRKDGTLIDYGVTVPSRKPSGKLRQATVIRTKTPITIDPKKVIAVPPTKLKDIPSEGKIVEPEKISSVKKETLTEPKHLPNPVKIVDAEKVSSTKKSVEPKARKTSREPSKCSKPEPKMQSKKPPTKEPEPKMQPKKPPTKEPSKTSLNSGDDNVMQFSKLISSEKIKNDPLEGTVTPSQSQLPKNLLSKKSPTLPEAPPNAPLEGRIVHSARVMDKKVASVDKLPLEGTVPVSSQQTGVKVAKDDNTFLKGSFAGLEKKLGNTGSAPFKGTIDYRPRNQDGLSTVISINEKSEGSVVERQSEGLPQSTVTETPLKKDEDSAKSGGTVAIPTGPAGLKPASSFAMTKVLPSDKLPAKSSREGSYREITSQKINSDEGAPFNEGPDTCVLFSSDTMRPEKDILYSSWLQRFKGKLDDDEIV